MMSPNKRDSGVENILKTLDIRKIRIKELFVEFCKSVRIPDLIGPDTQWAIIGGAVRDYLVDPEILTKRFWDPWRDIDIATVQVPDFSKDRTLYSKKRPKITTNRFGGYSVTICEDIKFDHVN